MATPPIPEPCSSEECRTISDSLMVFRSTEPSATTHETKKMALKTTNTRIKLRKSTPAPRPILKGGGRKRFSFTPSPELKPSFKKSAYNDLIEERGRVSRNKRNLLADLSEVADVVNIPPPPESSLNDDEAYTEKNQDMAMAMICYTSSMDAESSPDSGEAAAGEDGGGRSKDGSQHQPWSKFEESTNANRIIGDGLVNLPKLSLETNVLLESKLETCNIGKSHGTLAVWEHMETKKDNILLIAHHESAEMLDSMAAQPLLAGGLPEHGQMVVAHASEPTPVSSSPMPATAQLRPSLGEMAYAKPYQPSSTGDMLEEGHGVAEPYGNPPHLPRH